MSNTCAPATSDWVEGQVTPIIHGSPEPDGNNGPTAGMLHSESVIFSNSKIINCCIHGVIKLDANCLRFLDTPEFQRLRDVRQCGTVYYVYPGRFFFIYLQLRRHSCTSYYLIILFTPSVAD